MNHCSSAWPLIKINKQLSDLLDISPLREFSTASWSSAEVYEKKNKEKGKRTMWRLGSMISHLLWVVVLGARVQLPQVGHQNFDVMSRLADFKCECQMGHLI